MKNRSMLLLALCYVLASGTQPVSGRSEIKWRLVFNDEFNRPNGSMPDTSKWTECPREIYLWNRWCKTTKENVFVRNGRLICRAIPNPDMKADTAAMFTGAIQTKGKYQFQYGKIEVRLRTNMKPGNFPAAWLMPLSAGTPYRYGEFDIFETFGNDGLAHQTVHSHRSFALAKEAGKRSFTKKMDLTKWHVYGMEWNKDNISFFVDGVLTGFYQKSNNQTLLKEGQWSFDRPFYIILNQSVGNDNWNTPDHQTIYETQFDWIRVYQKE